MIKKEKNHFSIGKGQVILKGFFDVFNLFRKMKENTSHTNSFVCFLEEFIAWQFAFEINWPLAASFNEK